MFRAWKSRSADTSTARNSFCPCALTSSKRLFAGEIGPSTGEMGTAMFWTGPNRLYRETIEKMKSRLADAGYVGYFDINCIATPRAVYPLEVTPRFGYPTVSI